MARNCSVCGRETSTADGYCTRTEECKAARLRKPGATTNADWLTGGMPPNVEDIVTETMDWIEQIARENGKDHYRRVMQRLAEECDERGHRGMNRSHEVGTWTSEELENA